jgi:hypothetical protein
MEKQAGPLMDRINKNKEQAPAPEKQNLEQGLNDVFGAFRSFILKSPASEKHMEVSKEGDQIHLRLFDTKDAVQPSYDNKLTVQNFLNYMFQKLIPGQQPTQVFDTLKQKGIMNLPKASFGSLVSRVKFVGSIQAKREAKTRSERLSNDRTVALSTHKKNFRVHVYNVEQHEAGKYKVVASKQTGHRVAFNEKVTRDELMECLKTAGLVKKNVNNKEITVRGDFDIGYTFAYKGIPQFKLLPEN